MNKKIETWRIVLFVLALVYMAVLWSKKDIATIYASVPSDQVFPLIVTTVGVSSLKLGMITAIALGLRHIIGKIKN